MSNQIEMDDVTPNLRITIEQHGCLAEVLIPESVIEEHAASLNLKEFLQNSMVDLYARLTYMIRKQQEENNGSGRKDAP
jgi:hypothetical protein